MQLTINRSTLVQELVLADALIEKKVTMPILAHVLLTAWSGGSLALAATSIDASLVVDGIETRGVEEAGQAALPAALLLSFLRTAPDGPVTITTTKTQARLTAGTAEIRMPLASVDDFPQVPAVPHTVTHVPAKTLRDLFRQTRYAAHTGAVIGNYAIPGVFIELEGTQIRFAATDTYRVAISYRDLEAPVDEKRKVIIPISKVSPLMGVLEATADDFAVGLAIDDRSIHFLTGTRIFSVRLIDMAPPNYARVVPSKHTTIVSIPRDAFLLSLKRVAVTGVGEKKLAVCDIRDGKLTLDVESPLGRATDVVAVELQGPPVRVGLCLQHVTEFMALMEIDTMMAGFGDELRQIVFGPVDPGVTCCVSAMRIDSVKAPAKEGAAA